MSVCIGMLIYGMSAFGGALTFARSVLTFARSVLTFARSVLAFASGGLPLTIDVGFRHW